MEMSRDSPIRYLKGDDFAAWNLATSLLSFQFQAFLCIAESPQDTPTSVVCPSELQMSKQIRTAVGRNFSIVNLRKMFTNAL